MSNQNQCPNCKRLISCGCAYRTASNGVQVCSLCLQEYEVSLKK